ncbi:hypothetical protein O181_000249 [Austropuccinia psidii MF-1]|uniref:Uncharacterized protein n=1 Tax=Austropuccinia psidii MF-1 TaxID=1389203 RepID=A0A9Q3B886_9BASI|nr:hypothetical protein [Austropuccinia psidii MF-1]
MSPLHLRILGFQRNQLEDREGLFRTRRPGRGHLGHSGSWQDIEGNHTHPDILFPIQQKAQTRGLERYGSSSSALPTPQRFISLVHGQQDVQPGIPLGRTWSWNPTRKLILLEVRENRIREDQATIQAIEEQLTQTGHTQIPSGSQGAGQTSSPVDSHHSKTNRSVDKSHHSSQSQEDSRRRQGYKGKDKTTFSESQRESDPMIQKLLYLVKEVHKSQN